MKAVIAGKINDTLASALKASSLELCSVTTAEELKLLPPETPVIIMRDTLLNPLCADKDAAFKAASALKAQDTLVYLLDKECDASPYLESTVIDTVSYLASKKRRVVVLMRSSRASGPDFDGRYKDARNLGVSFIKYEKLGIEEENDTYIITANDGKLSVKIEAALLVDCYERDTCEFEEFTAALRLKTYDDGQVSGGRWFLEDTGTFRRNVKILDSRALADKAAEIAPVLVQEVEKLSKPMCVRTASVDIKKCAFCYTCYRICPHSALSPDTEAAAMKVNELLCNACGLCASVCPAAAIEFKGGETVKAESNAKLKVFCCENSAFIASKDALGAVDADIESIPCGGDISAFTMTGALKQYANVLVAVCCDEACKHYDGNKRLIKQVERLKERLEKMGENPARISCVQTSVTMSGILKEVAERALAGGVEK